MNYKKAYHEISHDNFPDEMTITFGEQQLTYRKRTWKIATEEGDVTRGLRYGENPGQEAALYELVDGNLVMGECTFISGGRGLVSGVQEKDLLQVGKHPGMTNLTDVDSALNILKYLGDEPAAVIVKHNNPSGVAVRATLVEAYREANLCDSIAAFGGVAVFNKALDKETAEEISNNYLEVVCAPSFESGVVDILKSRKNLRIIQIGNIERLSTYAYERFLQFRSLIDGGIIVQQSPLNLIRTVDDFKKAEAERKGEHIESTVTPTKDVLEDMLFGWRVEQGVTSNSVIYVKNKATVGIGTGEQDRVGVAEIAAFKAYKKYADRIAMAKHGKHFWMLEQEVRGGSVPHSELVDIQEQVEEEKGNLKGSVMISDAFFPFPDTVEVARQHGVVGIVQPGGSLNDHMSIEAANRAGIAMVFTGQRAFKH